MLISGFTILALVCVFILTVALLWYYPARTTRWYVYFLVFVSWFMAFGVVVLIPFDVRLVLATQTLSTEAGLEEERHYLRYCWRVVYWLVFFLCWFILPILQEFEIAGEFTVWKRLKRAVRRLLWMFFLMLTAGLMFVIYLGMTGNLVLAHMPYVLIAFSNCWGLFQTIFLLGYGLVAMPRYLWHESNYSHYLKYLAHKASLINGERNDFELRLYQLVTLAQAASEQVREDSPLRQYVEIVLKQVSTTQCPKLEDLFHRAPKQYTDREVLEELGEVTKSKLVMLNRLLKQAVFEFHRTNSCFIDSQWDQLLTVAFNTMALVNSQDSPDHLINSALWDRHTKRKHCTRVLQWVWLIKVKPILSKLLAIVLAAASLVIIAGESTLFLETPVGLLPLLFKQDYGDWVTQLYAAVPLVYLESCTYFALFRLKLSGFYGLYGHNQTDAPCLAWNAGFLARMACPLSLNFLLFIKVRDAEFFQVMRVINFVPFMGENFCIFFPLLLIICCLLNLLDVYPMIMEWLGYPQFIMGRKENQTQIDRGLELIEKAKKEIEEKLGAAKPEYTQTVGKKKDNKTPLL